MTSRLQAKKKKKEKKLQKQTQTIMLRDKQLQLKSVKYSQMMTSSITSNNQFILFGDVVIDINQLINPNHVNVIAAHNNFTKVLSIVRKKQYYIYEVHLDTHTYGITDMTGVIQQLRSTQTQPLYTLADMVEAYYKEVTKCMIDQKKYIDSCSSSENHQESEVIKQKEEKDMKAIENNASLENMDAQKDYLKCNEAFGWDYQKSLIKAQQSLDQLNNKMKDSNSFYGYIIFKGRKYDQVKSIIGHNPTILKDFMCLNEDQIDYLLLRKPIIFPLITGEQYIQQIMRRLYEARLSCFLKSADYNRFREEPTLTQSVNFTVRSVDSLQVETVTSNYLYVLSNYQNKKDDILVISVYTPLGQFKASDILSSQRKLKQCTNFNPYETTFSNKESDESSSIQQPNSMDNLLAYSDLVYEAQSELFKEKFYSIIDNTHFHDINQYL